MEVLIQDAAVELAEAALALLHTGKAHPVTQAQRAYRAESQGRLEERYVQKLMQYHRRKERAKSPQPKDRV